MADQTRKEMEIIAERFTASMALLNMPANPPPPAGREATPVPAMVGGVALQSKDAEEALNLARSLANELSKLQSELKLVEAEAEGIAGLRKDVEKVKEEAGAMREEVRKEGEARAREVGEVKKESVVAKLQAATAKNEAEAARKEVDAVKKEAANVGLGLGEVQRVVGELKQGLAQIGEERGDFLGQLIEVRQGVGGVRQEIEEVRQEMGRLKKEAEERSAAAVSGKRDRNRATPAGDTMDVDEGSRPAKRTRLDDPAQPSPISVSQSAPTLLAPPPGTDSTTLASGSGLLHRKLEERIVALEEYVTAMENEFIQLGVDVRERLDEFAEHVGLEPGGTMRGATSGAGDMAARSESAPPKSSPTINGVAGMRSSAPPAVSPTRAKLPDSPLQNVAEASANSVHKDEEVYELLAGLRNDLGDTQLQMLKLWRAEDEWPAAVGRNLNAALGVKSIEEVWHKAAEVARAATQTVDKPNSQPAVNGAKPVNGHAIVPGHKEEGGIGDGASDTLALVRGLKEEMREMRARVERSEAECNALRVQQAEQRKILVQVRDL